MARRVYRKEEVYDEKTGTCYFCDGRGWCDPVGDYGTDTVCPYCPDGERIRAWHREREQEIRSLGDADTPF